jgi:lipopolysaccharide biosynthesis glycosyltransferase
MKQDYLKEWKKAAGIRLWEDFFKREYTPKFEALNKSLNRMLEILSFDSKDQLTVGTEGFASLLTAGHIDSNGNASFTYKKLYFRISVDALAKNFEEELHRVFNFEFSRLSDLAHHWDKRQCYYGQSPDRCEALGIRRA